MTFLLYATRDKISWFLRIYFQRFPAVFFIFSRDIIMSCTSDKLWFYIMVQDPKKFSFFYFPVYHESLFRSKSGSDFALFWKIPHKRMWNKKEKNLQIFLKDVVVILSSFYLSPYFVYTYHNIEKVTFPQSTTTTTKSLYISNIKNEFCFDDIKIKNGRKYIFSKFFSF